MSPATPDKLTDLQAAMAEHTNAMAAEYKALANLAPDQIANKVLELHARALAKAQLDVTKKNEEAKARVARYDAALTAFKMLANDTMKDAWAELVEGFTALPAEIAPNLIFNVFRNDDGVVGEPTVIIGRVIKVRNNHGAPGPRSIPITVDGTVYASAAAAKVELLKIEHPMNRTNIVAALQAKGLKVTDSTT